MLRSLPLLLLVGLFLAPTLGVACDVDLMALFTGESPADAFSQSIFQLASEAKDIGRTITNPEAVHENILRLMRSWIRFDNRFSQNPPSWAKEDPNWQAKFKQIADLIGTFEARWRKNHLTRLHTDVLGFSRRLFGLLSAMPMSPQSRSLVRFTSYFQTLWDAVIGSDPKAFGKGVEEFAREARAYRSLLATETLFLTHDFLTKIDQLDKMHLASPASLTYEMSLQVAVAETAFKEMNAGLRAAGKRD